MEIKTGIMELWLIHYYFYRKGVRIMKLCFFFNDVFIVSMEFDLFILQSSNCTITDCPIILI